LGVGGIGTVAHYAIFLAVLGLAPTAVLVASTAGATVGASVNYWLNHRYSFASQCAHREAFPRFALVAGARLVANWAVMAALTLASVPAIPAQVFASGGVLLTGFLLNRNWTFVCRIR
jgi:putative flippase GtrA